MGYYAYSASAEFFIKNEDVQAALDAINKISSVGANFSDFEEAMADYNFIVEADAEGNYDSICFPEEKWRDADVLLEAIAPYQGWFVYRNDLGGRNDVEMALPGWILC